MAAASSARARAGAFGRYAAKSWEREHLPTVSLGHFVGTSPSCYDRFIAFSRVGPRDVLLDLGCGSCSLLAEVVERTGCGAVGVEVNPELCRQGEALCGSRGLASRVSLVCGRAEDIKLEFVRRHRVTVVYIFLIVLAKHPGVVDLLRTLMGSGVRVITHQYPLPKEHFPPPAEEFPAPGSAEETLAIFDHRSQAVFYAYGHRDSLEDMDHVDSLGAAVAVAAADGAGGAGEEGTPAVAEAVAVAAADGAGGAGEEGTPAVAEATPAAAGNAAAPPSCRSPPPQPRPMPKRRSPGRQPEEQPRQRGAGAARRRASAPVSSWGRAEKVSTSPERSDKAAARRDADLAAPGEGDDSAFSRSAGRAAHRRPASRPRPRPNLWRVVGGAGWGGILVRAGRDLASDKLPQRLSCGATVQELVLDGDRLYFFRLSGTGPLKGWITVALEHKLLAERITGEHPLELATPALVW